MAVTDQQRPDITGVSGPVRAWAITLSATFASTYALDAIATLSGLGVAMLPLSQGAGFGAALVFLLLSYLAWGVGLSINLRANRMLLDATGTSTNALSKLLYDIAGRRSARRWQGLAADLGYVGMEIGKEAPYYLGATGAALATDAVTATDAMIFLGGANLGAAFYEYGLARMVRRILAPSRAAPADFISDWCPQIYLRDYYTTVEPDEAATLRAFVTTMRDAPPGRPVLVFGCGPTVHHACLAAPHASRIDLCDFLPANLAAVADWQADRRLAHDWRHFLREILRLETGREPDAAAIAARERLARARIGHLAHADMLADPPIRDLPDARYGTVIAAYCADSATADRRDWQTGMARIASLVEPGGLFLVAALDRASQYRVGQTWFPSARVSEGDLRKVLAQDFDNASISVACHPDLLDGSKGYSGILLASARKPFHREGPSAPLDGQDGL
jgi:NNMT/PNMT/TEMT family